MDMQEALSKLKTRIVAEYVATFGDTSDYHKNYALRMSNGEILTHSEGKKYIRISREDSVWGFIVNCHDDKQFKYGDILKAATWRTPARNQARGNIFDDNYSITWCSPAYLK